MAKTKQQKKETLEHLQGNLKNSSALVFCDYKGLNVVDVSELRRLCREKGVNYFVAKKTLLKLALEKTGIADVDPTQMEGNLAIAFSKSDEVSAAKILNDFSKKHEQLKILGGVLENHFIDINEVKNLAQLPSKEELLAKLVGSLNSPVSGFVNVLAGNLRNLVNVLNAVKDKK